MYSPVCNEESSLTSAYIRAKQKYIRAKRQSNKQDKKGAKNAGSTASVPQELKPTSTIGRMELNDSPSVDSEQARISHRKIIVPSHLRTNLVENGLKKFNLRRPNASMDNFESSVEIEDQIEKEIRISGLRKGRENALIGLVNELRAVRRASMLACTSSFDRWTQHADECILAATRQLDKSDKLITEANKMREQAEEKAQQATDMLASAHVDIDAAKSDARKAHEDLSRADALAIEMSKESEKNWTVKMETAVIETKKKLSAEHTITVNEMQKSFESERQRLKNDILTMKETSIETQQEVARWQEEVSRLKKQLETCKQGRDSDKRCYEELCGNIKADLTKSQQSLSAAKEQIKQYREEWKIIEEEQKIEIAQLKELQRKELEAVEARVKKIISAKEQQIQQLTEKSSEYENRARTVEGMISNLHNGFHQKLT